MSTQQLKEYSFVNIHGLQSDAGKKLNGACGIVINSRTTVDANGNTRYPIRIYAQLKEGSNDLYAVNPVLDTEIRSENLQENARLPEEQLHVFQDAIAKALASAQGVTGRDISKQKWWSRCYHVVLPDETSKSYHYLYASLLFEEGETQEAATIFWDLYQGME